MYLNNKLLSVNKFQKFTTPLCSLSKVMKTKQSKILSSTNYRMKIAFGDGILKQE